MLRRSTCLLNVSQVWLKTFLLVEFHYLWLGVQWLALLLTSKTIPAFLVLSDHICPELSGLRFPYSFFFLQITLVLCSLSIHKNSSFSTRLLLRSLVKIWCCRQRQTLPLLQVFKHSAQYARSDRSSLGCHVYQCLPCINLLGLCGSC